MNEQQVREIVRDEIERIMIEQQEVLYMNENKEELERKKKKSIYRKKIEKLMGKDFLPKEE